MEKHKTETKIVHESRERAEPTTQEEGKNKHLRSKLLNMY